MAHRIYPETLAGSDPRKDKNYFRKYPGMGEVDNARGRGEDHGYRRKPKRNPYPPGKRHDAYEEGYELMKCFPAWEPAPYGL